MTKVLSYPVAFTILFILSMIFFTIQSHGVYSIVYTLFSHLRIDCSQSVRLENFSRVVIAENFIDFLLCWIQFLLFGSV